MSNSIEDLVEEIPVKECPVKESPVEEFPVKEVDAIIENASQEELNSNSFENAALISQGWEAPFNTVSKWFDCPYLSDASKSELSKLILSAERQCGEERSRVYDFLQKTCLGACMYIP